MGGNGVFGYSTIYNGNGIVGVSNNGPNAYGVYGSSVGYGVYATSTAHALYANGPAGGTTGWNSASDARYKTGVVTLYNALDTVLNIRGVNYDWDRAKWPNKISR